MIDYSDEFIKAIENKDKLTGVYSEWIETLFSSHLWDIKNIDGMRIPWMKAEEAFDVRKDIFDSPGLYIFGTKENMPIYLGMAKGRVKTRSLKTRLRSRYFGPKSESSKNKKYAQFQIAKEYEKLLNEKGHEALPKDVSDWYHKRYKNSDVRLIHAEELVKRGIDGVWFAGLPFPVDNPETIREIEKKIIPIANSWNIKHKFPELINKQDT